MSNNSNNLYFESLPFDIQNKICQHITYPQNKDLLKEIRLRYFYRSLMAFMGKKKHNVSINDVLYELGKNVNNDLTNFILDILNDEDTNIEDIEYVLYNEDKIDNEFFEELENIYFSYDEN